MKTIQFIISGLTLIVLLACSSQQKNTPSILHRFAGSEPLVDFNTRLIAQLIMCIVNQFRELLSTLIRLGQVLMKCIITIY